MATPAPAATTEPQSRWAATMDPVGTWSSGRRIATIAIAAGIAWWLGTLAGQQRPVFAALVPILVIRSDTATTLRGSAGRVLGVLAGVGVGLAALAVARPDPVVVGLVVATALAVDRLLGALPRVGLDTKNQSAVSALLMLFVASSVTSYAVARIWETAIGAGVALIVGGCEVAFTARFAHRAPASAVRG